MKIRKKSWHYRMIKNSVGQYYDDPLMSVYNRRVSLCTYFWTVVLRLLVILMQILTVLFLLLFIVGVTYFHPYETLTFVLAITGIILVVVSGAVVGTNLHKWRHNRERLIREPGLIRSYWRHNRERLIREPGLIRSYWRAHKEKVCPIIEFTD